MFKGGSLWTGLISGAISQLKDTHAVTAGNMNKKDFAFKHLRILRAVLVSWPVLNMEQ